jgi:hypothetical protein
MIANKAFTTVKQVKAALHRNREILGRTPILTAHNADGEYGRIYQVLVCTGEGDDVRIEWILKGQWANGAMDRRELLAWANQTLTA